MNDADTGIAVTVVAVVLLVTGGIVCDATKCDEQWRSSGMKSDYGVMKGCTIEVTPGKWIPADRYREVTP